MLMLAGVPTPMLSQRLNKASSLSEKLFAINTLGDDRVINATYVAGKQVYKKGQHYVATAV